MTKLCSRASLRRLIFSSILSGFRLVCPQMSTTIFHSYFLLLLFIPSSPPSLSPSPICSSGGLDDAYFGGSEGPAVECEAFLRDDGDSVVFLVRHRKLKQRLVKIGIKFVAG